MITRQVFQDAIEAGITTADLSAAEAEALREVGRTATVFGTNFDCGPGCPAVLAGLYVDDGDERVFRFACAFDKAVAKASDDRRILFNRETVQVDG